MKAKKVLAMLVASAMIMGTTVTAFASDTTYDDAARVIGLENDKLTVKAYQIITYNKAGYYEEVKEDTITKSGTTEGGIEILAPTASDIENLAAMVVNSETTNDFTCVTFTADTTTPPEGDYKKESLSPGGWLVLVSGSNEYLYNPAIISVNVTSDGTKYGELNYKSDKWNSPAYPKRSEPTIIKTAEKEDADDTDVVGVQYGDVLKFTVTADIPDYASDVKDIEQYIISDTLDGLSLVKDADHKVSVQVDDVEDVSAIYNIINPAIVDGANAFSAKLSDDSTAKKFLLDNGGKKIVITYYAEVTSNAKINVDEINNTATLSYSTRGGVAEKEAETNHYTFGFDTAFNGNVTTENKTGEFIKIDSEGSVEYEQGSGVVKSKDPLDGAVFELRIGSAGEGAEVFGTFTTDQNGRLEVNGLDPDVTYYLVEIQAPLGYTVNSTPVQVNIIPTYVGGELTGYNVKFDGNVTHYKYENGTTTIINTPDTPSNPHGFKNTSLAELPSTGGIGTTIFTIGGCVIMVTAAGLYFATRKKEQK